VTDEVWSAQDTSPAEIEAALRELLVHHHAEVAHDAPARVLNLIAIVDREWRGEVENRLEKVGRYHASRTVLCAVESKRTTIDARVRLIADDEPHVVELVRVTLEDERVRVVEASDGAAALELAAELDPELIFLDVNLPDMSGLEVCRRLRKQSRTACAHIVMLTAAAQQDDVARGLAAGATHYLTKPFSPVRLLSLVESLLPGTAWLPE